MKKKIFTERFDIRMNEETRKILRQISKALNTTESEAVRICICEYWERI